MTKQTVMAAAMAAAVLVSGVGGMARGQVQLDPGLQPYKTVSGVSGNIKSVGSDTLNNLMTLLGRGLQEALPERQHPDRRQGLRRPRRRR